MLRALVLVCAGGCASAPPPIAPPPPPPPAPVAAPPGAACLPVIMSEMERGLRNAKIDGTNQPVDRRMRDEMRKMMTMLVKPEVAACITDAWSPALLRCIDTTTDPRSCEALMTPAQRAHLDELMASALGPTPQHSGVADEPPRECDDYRTAIDAAYQCDLMPKVARDALRDGFAKASKGWDQLPPDAKLQLAKACKVGADAVREANLCK